MYLCEKRFCIKCFEIVQPDNMWLLRVENSIYFIFFLYFCVRNSFSIIFFFRFWLSLYIFSSDVYFNHISQFKTNRFLFLWLKKEIFFLFNVLFTEFNYCCNFLLFGRIYKHFFSVFVRVHLISFLYPFSFHFIRLKCWVCICAF